MPNVAGLLAPTLGNEMNDADRYRWLVNHARSFDGTGDSDNMARLWFYRPDGREVMVQGADMDALIAEADKERRAILALQGKTMNEQVQPAAAGPVEPSVRPLVGKRKERR